MPAPHAAALLFCGPICAPAANPSRACWAKRSRRLRVLSVLEKLGVVFPEASVVYESGAGGPAATWMPLAATAIVEPINAWAKAPIKLRLGAAGPGVKGGACGAASVGLVGGCPDGTGWGIGGAVGALVGSEPMASLPPAA